MKRSRLGWWGLLLLATLGTSACYKSRLGIIEQGEQAPVSGAFDCVYPDRDGGFAVTMTEARSGRGRYAEFRYLDPDGRSYKLARMPSGLYLVQTGNESGDYEYAFVEFRDDGGFATFVEDAAGRWPLLHGRLAASGLHFRRDGELVMLRGSPSQLRAFLLGHERGELRETSRCTPHR